MADIEVSCDLQNKKDINASFSDVIDINLQKEIKMGIELNAPLYIGADTNLQQQVTQNTADIADLKQDVSDIESDIGNLNNLDTVDKSSVVNAINEALSVLDPTQTADYINNSKGLKSGEISTNSIILNDIKDYAHSTFDRPKFTVVGSPIITDDGIASGFSSTSYIDFIASDFATADSWEFDIKFKTESDITANQIILGSYYAIFGLDLNIGSAALKMCLGSTGSNFNIYNGTLQSVTANTDYWVKIKFTGTHYVVDVSTDGTNYTNRLNLASTTKILSTVTGIALGMLLNNKTQIFTGSIDLKQFSITVDGVEVFSGNKTGVDTIKPDDYTVVGTPTISDDGILSNVSLSNYLSKTLSLTYTNTCEVIYSVNTKSISDRQRIYGGDIGGVVIGITGTNYITVAANYIDGTSAISRSFEAKANTNYLLKVKDDGTNLTVWYKESGGDWIQVDVSVTKTSNIKLSGVLYIGRQRVDNPFLGTIDLNEVKIITDGNLAYQPCLKIAYTESKTGSKIVDSIYRDRVNDMADQFGYANYYTLDEDNGNFTLPQVELYGLIGQRTLRDSYRNGINYWELYSNRDLEQGGSCTSGVEVTFARPFADTNYVLSVPYSAKSTTAFTPTQTGDWIAKGKGLL